MFKKSYWYGKECEGRLHDIETVFCRKEIPDNYKNYPHMYLTIEFITKMISDEKWGIEQEELLMNDIGFMMLTIEANSDVIHKIPINIKQKAHIIYRIKDKNIDVLKSTDTISIDQDHYNVYQVTKENMFHSSRDDYKYDRVKE